MTGHRATRRHATVNRQTFTHHRDALEFPRSWQRTGANVGTTSWLRRTAAIKRIRPGDRVFVGSACGEPQELVRALVDSAGGAEDTEVLNVLTMGVAPYTDPKYSDRFRANAFFIGNSVRDAVGQVRADYTPIFFSQIPEMFRSGRLPIDVALIMVSPPDQFGFCSLGVSVDMTRAAALSAKLLVAQVNRYMPRTLGQQLHSRARYRLSGAVTTSPC